MLLTFVSVTLGATASVASTKADWYECLEAYAQVQLLAAQSPVAIASAAMAVCSDERKAFQVELSSDRSIDGPTFFARLADEDSAAARHAIAFVNLNRRR